MAGSIKYKVNSERQIFKKFFKAIFIYSQSFCQKTADKKFVPQSYGDSEESNDRNMAQNIFSIPSYHRSVCTLNAY